MTGVVGRDAELIAIDRALAERETLVALAIEGEPGIGKTTLWMEAIHRADARGWRVLRARPAAAESKLAFSVVADLLGAVGDEELPVLPPPQRLAVDVATSQAHPPDSGVPARALGAAMVSILSALAAREHLVIAIDDLQWADPQTAGALRFAFRRLADVPLTVITTRRVDAAVPPTNDDILPEGTERIAVGPLSLSGLHHVIAHHAGISLPRPALLKVLAASEGNPLFALEVARALGADARRLKVGEPMPIPERLGPLLRARLARLPTTVRRKLLAIALTAQPEPSSLARAFGSMDETIDVARDRDILEVRDGRLRFAHPLLADAIVNMSTDDERREIHSLLAAISDDRAMAARHRALATLGADFGVAADLEEAARHAIARGAAGDAADLLELAVRLSPESDSLRDRRRIAWAGALLRSGGTGDAQAMLDDLIAELPAGPDRARALELRAHVDWVAGSGEAAERRCAEALGMVGADPSLRARVLVTMARVTVDGARRVALAREAISLLDTLADPDLGLVGEALVQQCGAIIEDGGEIPWSLIERGLALEKEHPPETVSDRMSASLGSWLKYAGDFEGARHWLERTRRAAIEEGDDSSLPYALSHLPQLETWRGDLAAARAAAVEHHELSVLTGQEGERLTAVYNLASVDAMAGRLDDARRRIAEAMPEAEVTDEWNVYQLLSVRGFVELSAGDLPAACEALSRSLEIWERVGARSAPVVYENLVEALVRTGRLDEAQPVADQLDALASPGTAPMSPAGAHRSRALLLAESGDLEAAAAEAEAAVGAALTPPIPFNLGRSRLIAGQIARRRGARRAARDALELARDDFAAAGAVLWQARAEAELGRLPIRRRAGADLTPTERRVAALVAQGHSNAEVARALFVTLKTVEANLTRVYAKLSVGSRTELAARLHREASHGAEAEL